MSLPNYNERAVVVTTDKRGVFFGYLEGEYSADSLTLKNARNCLYWDNEVKGFLGLVAGGPNEACRVGPAAPSLTLFGITSISLCTDDAVAKWESAPWG